MAKPRSGVPPETVAEVMFASHRTCCCCRVPERPLQIHHLDEQPTNHAIDNLAVLCVDCHHKTQVKGGFARTLDAMTVERYRDDWTARVAATRAQHGHSAAPIVSLPQVDVSRRTAITTDSLSVAPILSWPVNGDEEALRRLVEEGEAKLAAMPRDHTKVSLNATLDAMGWQSRVEKALAEDSEARRYFLWDEPAPAGTIRSMHAKPMLEQRLSNLRRILSNPLR